MESWKDIPGWETLYQISNTGKVKSLYRYKKELKQSTTEKGYKYVSLPLNGKWCNKRVHVLVAIVFIPNPENKPFVNHKDGDKTNNNYWNLEWVTSSENTIHALTTGLKIPIKGQNHANSKLTDEKVILIRKLYSETKTSFRKLGKQFNVSGSVIQGIVTNKTWKHLL